MATKTVTLYHGSDAIVERVTDTGLFGGVFAAELPPAALGHGPVLTVFEIEESRVLSDCELNYELDYATVRAALVAELPAGLDGEAVDAAWDIVIDGGACNGEDAPEIFGDDLEEAGWEAQRIRGRVARALGYAAVEMLDEHGTVYLVLDATGAPA